MMAAARIQQWVLCLRAYQYKLQYTPGRQMFNSDALSRLPRRAPEPVPDDEPAEYVLSLETLEEGGVTTQSSLSQDDWTLLPETSVCVRNYYSGDKWIPGRVKTTSGSRMATVETSGGLAQRHADQVRLQRNSSVEHQQQSDGVIEQRLASSPPTTARKGDPATNTPRCANSPVRVPGVASPPQPTTRSAPTNNTARSPQQILRRSTRTRRPRSISTFKEKEVLHIVRRRHHCAECTITCASVVLSRWQLSPRLSLVFLPSLRSY
ncbi:uncharacterized protein LOC142804232 [Rhipicephalus microplus]|uniref:uncharacterized protein LOC142804232 n=1 Tax=Rhipicephalus microplus TaxID=6941 RepID=UPI003F6B4C33